MSPLTDQQREDARKEDEALAGTADGFDFRPGFGGGSELTDKFSGAGIADTIVLLNKGIEEDNKALMAAAGVALGFDTVGLVLNPFGSLIAAGVGWLIDHLFFLREPLDLLMGDNLAVNAQTKRIKAEAEEYAQRIVPDHENAVKLVDSWESAAADLFRADMAKVADELAAVGEAIKGLASIMGKMSACVTAFRSAVRDIIAMTVGGLIGSAIAAVAMMPFTFGTSIAVFVVSAVGIALSALAKIMNLISKLTSILGRNAGNASKVGGKLNTVATNGARQNRPVSKPPPKSGPAPTNPSSAPAIKPGGSPAPPQRTNSAPTNPSSAPAVPIAPPQRINSAPPAPSNAAPKPPAQAQPKPPAQAQPKPPAKPTPNKPYKPTHQDMAKLPIKQRMQALQNVTDQALAKALVERLGKTHAEAYHIVRVLRNIEGVAAPGGVVRVGPKSYAVGDLVHASHELWKEFGGLAGGGSAGSSAPSS